MPDATPQHDFLDPEILSAVLTLPLRARQAMMGSVSGMHRSPVKGSSLEFAQYRKYVPGDDLRRLDWRAWGRSDRYFIKEFEADTNLRLYLLVDASGSMNFSGAAGESRIHYAQKLAASLAYLASHQGDAAGLIAGAQDYRKEVPAKRGPTHLGILMDQLAEVRPQGETDFISLIHETAEKVSQRAMVVLISDFLFPLDTLSEALQHLRYRKHDVVMFHLLDEMETSFSVDRPTRFVDLENISSIVADPAVIKTRYLEAVDSYLSEMSDLIQTSAADYHRINLATPCQQVLAEFLTGHGGLA